MVILGSFKGFGLKGGEAGDRLPSGVVSREFS